MPDEVRFYLITRLDGTYLDMTCGGGGHLKILSKSLSEKAVLFGLDRDIEAVTAAQKNLMGAPQVIKIVNKRFSEIDDVARDNNLEKVDGVLFDFGVSSHQINSAKRGFSFMQDGPLDMRMNTNDALTAEQVVNDYTADQLINIFRKYGEEKRARKIVTVLDKNRQKQRIDTTQKLKEVLETVIPKKDLNSTLARLYQAIRIEVNGELDEISNVLPKSFDLLAPGGRMVCMSYHSLEDRIVKRFFADLAKGCVCPDNFPVCACGQKPKVKVLTKKVVQPKKEEVESNSRARSARLRAIEKL